MRSRYLTALLIMLMSFGLTGCAGFGLYKNTEKNVNQVQAQVDAVKLHNLPDNRQLSNPAHYTNLANETGSISNPAWLNQRVNVHGRNLSIDFLTNRIVANTGANVSYDAGTNPNQNASVDYTGTIRGALNNLAENTGYNYSINGNTILWSSFVTKTFDVSFMPGSSQYLMGQQASLNTSHTSAGSATTVSAAVPDTQYSTLQGTLSVWQDLQNTIKNMLSADGKVMVSQATTTITVRDHPENVREIQEYLTSMNRDLSRQVALQVQVLQINLRKAFQYGVDWNIVKHNFQSQGGLEGEPIDTLGDSLSPIGKGAALSNFNIGFVRSADQQILMSALQQQGELSVVTQPRVVTLNNQVARIAITTARTYLASVTTTVTGGTTNAVQTSLNPGLVTTGFTMYVLPKIIGSDVLLQLTSELSNLDSMQQLQSGSGDDANLINAPTVSSKSFNQRSMVPSGSTLVLAGFRQVNNEANKASFFGIEPLGGKGAQQINSETIVLITPVIVGNMG